MASKRPAQDSKTSRRRLQEIELTPSISAYPVEIKVLVDGKEVHRLPRIERKNVLHWKDLLLPCDLRDDSNLTVQITEIRTLKNRVGFAVYRMSQVANDNNLSTECHNRMYTSKVSFQGHAAAERAYADALTKVKQMESRSGLKASGTVGTAFKTLLVLGSTLSELDPTGGSKIAFALCTKAWEHMEKLEKQDAELDDLVLSLARMTPAIESVQQIADANLEDTATEMLNLIEDASLFILSYKSQTVFEKAWQSTVNSNTRDQINDVVNKFRRLKEEFDTRVGTQTLVVGQETLAVGVETLKVGAQVLAAVHSNSNQESLAKLNPAGHAIYNPDRGCTPDTRVQAIGDIIDWVRDDEKEERMLWVYGFAGLGKSSIAASVCQRLEAEGRLTASFFCKRDDPALRDPRSVLNTIVYGLAIRNEAYRGAVADAIWEDQQICGAPIQRRYTSLVETPLKSLEQGRALRSLVVVIDALDETQRDEDRASLLACLRKMCQLMPWLKIIVTSRPDEDIRAEFDGDGVTSLDIANHDATDDILTFVRQRMAGIAKKKKIGEWPDEKLRKLAGCANGLFVWAETACKFIAGGLSPGERLDQILGMSRSTAKSHPLSGLDSLYTTAIQAGIDDDGEDNRRLVLQCIGAIIATSARTPLPVASLEQLLSEEIEPGVLGSVVRSLGSVLYEDGGAGGPLRMFHPSFEDFATDPDRSKGFYVDLTQQNTTLASCCLNTMLRDLRFNICGLETSHILNRDIPDLPERVQNKIVRHLRYSCLFWYNHLTQAETNATEEVLREFLFGKELIYWLEALGLIGNLEVALSSMTGLASLTSESPGLSECSSYANDVYRFVLSFYDAISESTPHLYISALPFAPTASEFGRRMRPWFPNTLAITQGADERWSSCLRSISHPDIVGSVAFSPDSRRVVSSCDDATVRVWDAETGTAVLNPLRGHSALVQCAVFSPNGRRIASCSYDQTIRVWDAETGSEVCAPLEGHSGVVLSIAFSPNGKRIASCSADQTVRIWDAETGIEVLGPLTGHSDVVMSVAFSRDGRYIASGSDDTTIRVCDAETGATVHEPLEGHSKSVLSVAFSSDDSLIVSGSSDSTLIIWDAKTGTRKLGPLRGHTAIVQSVAFSPDDRRILSGSADGTVRFWDVESGRELVGQPRSHSDRVWCVAFSPDGRRVASASADKTVQIWDAESGVAQSAPPRLSAAVNAVAFSSDGRFIASGSRDGLVRIWDAITGGAVREPLQGHAGHITSVAFSPNGRHMVSGSGDMTLRIWDSETGVVVLGLLEGHSGWVWSVAFSPNGQLLASGSADKTVRIWDAETGAATLEPLRGHTDRVNSVAFSPDGGALISGSGDNTVRVWDTKTGALLLGPLQGHSQPVSSVAFSPDGNFIASGSLDLTVRIWDAETGTSAQTLRGHSDRVTSVAFSPDSRLVVSCSMDQAVRIWEAATGTSMLKPLRGHSHNVRSVSFSPDGHRIASGSDDGTIRMWDANRSYMRVESLLGLVDDLPTLTTSELAHLADPNGWVRASDGELLIWLPGNYRIIDDSLMCISPAPVPARPMIDFSRFVHGSSWSSVSAV
ncbi:hypothetical protein FRC08_002303 [Ceratobasidium sp. 394]|nr:hypothetical protein FRC08_002303 [Ceratobasidium sp. 394]